MSYYCNDNSEGDNINKNTNRNKTEKEKTRTRIRRRRNTESDFLFRESAAVSPASQAGGRSGNVIDLGFREKGGVGLLSLDSLYIVLFI